MRNLHNYTIPVAAAKNRIGMETKNEGTVGGEIFLWDFILNMPIDSDFKIFSYFCLKIYKNTYLARVDFQTRLNEAKKPNKQYLL